MPLLIPRCLWTGRAARGRASIAHEADCLGTIFCPCLSYADAEKFSTYFFNAPIFTIKGRMFPVEKFYAKAPETDYMDAALTTIMQASLG